MIKKSASFSLTLKFLFVLERMATGAMLLEFGLYIVPVGDSGTCKYADLLASEWCRQHRIMGPSIAIAIEGEQTNFSRIKQEEGYDGDMPSVQCRPTGVS